MTRTFPLAALALASALTLTACGTETTEEDPGTDTSSSTTGSAEQVSSEHNEADVTFAQMMIPHHQQAVEMSEILLADEDISTDVADFAQGVIDAQGPEIERMNAMLEAWGEEPMDTGNMDTGDMDGSDHGGMSGMMSQEDLTALEEAQGTEASRLYLAQMIIHHEGAVEMAQSQVDDGKNPQALRLAEQVIDAQEAEITEMEQMIEDL